MVVLSLGRSVIYEQIRAGRLRSRNLRPYTADPCIRDQGVHRASRTGNGRCLMPARRSRGDGGLSWDNARNDGWHPSQSDMLPTGKGLSSAHVAGYCGSRALLIAAGCQARSCITGADLGRGGGHVPPGVITCRLEGSGEPAIELPRESTCICTGSPRSISPRSSPGAAAGRLPSDRTSDAADGDLRTCRPAKPLRMPLTAESRR